MNGLIFNLACKTKDKATSKGQQDLLKGISFGSLLVLCFYYLDNGTDCMSEKVSVFILHRPTVDVEILPAQ